MRKPLFSILTVLSLGACVNEQEVYLDNLWSPEVASVNDGVYVRLPSAGKLIRVEENGDLQLVEMNGAKPNRLVVTPNGENVLAFSEWTECKNDDEEIIYVSDCEPEEIQLNSELQIIKNGVQSGKLDIPSFFIRFNKS